MNLFLLLISCTNSEKSNDGNVLVDSDGDGFDISEDCRDDDASINPSAEEICDEVDNNCDGQIDEGLLDTFYVDADGDGHGNDNFPLEACVQPENYVVSNQDCDDGNEFVSPDMEESCDGIDNNCDGEIDEGVQINFFVDADGDGFGDSTQTVEACSMGLGLSEVDGDCDDENVEVSPNAIEICDGIDNNCIDGIDESSALDAVVWYLDFDSDEYGTSSDTQNACVAPEGYVATADDCDDLSTDINPGIPEICNNIDDDCDGVIDEADSTDAQTWYLDYDNDGYGENGYEQTSCYAPLGYVDNDDDCAPIDANANPAASELCNGVDDDCDEDIDEDDAIDAQTWFIDYDDDGYGEATFSLVTCTPPAGYVSNANDCSPNDPNVHPGAPEGCDGIDTNCDGQLGSDEVDGDGDGHLMCADCNDNNIDIYPDAPMVCDDVDNNCDGFIDFDGDQDGFSAFGCGGSDCLDIDASIFPDLNGDCFYCGDGFLDSGEFCDDGGTQAGDGCSDLCIIEDNTICAGEPSICETDAEPDPFHFTSTDGVEFQTTVASQSITLSGFYGGLVASVSSNDTTPSLVVNGVNVQSTTATVAAGDDIAISMSSANDFSILHQATLTLGNHSTTWDLTTKNECVAGSEIFSTVLDADGDGFSDSVEFIVPEGCEEIEVVMWGAGGGGGGDYCGTGGGAGGFGGGGAFASATLSVTPLEILDVHVGMGGDGGSYSHATTGGGHSGVFRVDEPLIIAGAGGGAGGSWHGATGANGGAGGGLVGLSGGVASPGSGSGGAGGTQTSGGTGGAGGITNGGYLFGGQRTTTGHSGTGTGGSGYYGGGSGSGAGSCCFPGGGGGGGSSFIPSNGTTEDGSGVTPGGSSHTDYPGGTIGYGANPSGDCAQFGNDGGNGYVLIRWFDN